MQKVPKLRKYNSVLKNANKQCKKYKKFNKKYKKYQTYLGDKQ